MNKITADMIGSSFQRDPELHLPQRPRFPPEIVMLPYGANGILFDGADGAQLVAGAGARALLPRLVQALDGRRTLDEIGDLFPQLPPAQLINAITLLYSRGLLEDGVDGTVPDTPQAGFMGRHVDSTRVNANRAEALGRLASTRLAIASAGAAPALAGALADTGLGAIETLSDPAGMSDGRAPTLGLFVVTPQDDPAKAGAWLDRAWAVGLPVLHLAAGASQVQVGPLFLPGQSASPDCFRRLLPETPAGAPDDLDVWVAIAAMNVQNIASRIGRMNHYNLCHVHHRHPGEPPSYREVRLCRLPGSAAAGLGHIDRAPRGDPDHLVWRLHNAANGMAPRSFLSPRDYQVHYSASNINATAVRPDPFFGAPARELPDGLTVDLPTPWTAPAPASEKAARLDLNGLATLLRHAAGHDGQRRIAPSAGGLGCVNLFVVARDVDGLGQGTAWHYDAPAHRLCHLGGVTDMTLCGALGARPDQLAQAVIVGAASTDKTQRKYNSFAFRFAHLDSGVARAYLTELSSASGIALCDYPHLGDIAAAQALGIALRGTANIVTFAAGLGRRGVALQAPSPQLRHGQEVTQLAELSAGTGPLADPDGRARVPQPVLGAPGASLTGVMRARRSVRVFRDQPVGIWDLSLLARAATQISDQLDASGALAVRLSLWAAIPAERDADMQGIWRCDRDADPVRIRDHLSVSELAQVMLQRSLAEAPLTLLMTARLHDALDHWGARGYRECYSRAGAVSARLLLMSQAMGLAGSPWGGLSEAAWGPLLGIDRYTDCPLFGVSIGHPADQPAEVMHV